MKLLADNVERKEAVCRRWGETVCCQWARRLAREAIKTLRAMRASKRRYKGRVQEIREQEAWFRLWFHRRNG